MKEKNHEQFPVIVEWPLTKLNLSMLLGMIGSSEEKSTGVRVEQYPVCRGCGEPLLPDQSKINIAGVVSHDRPSCVLNWFQR
ncbi:hypothetical protein EPO14_03680 [Patescibacteria group bacterium]|nr:MAG: hypothetical protein EPO14_03680 [Patescibacteria group bacterium]